MTTQAVPPDMASDQPALAHHFDDLAQQRAAASFGMWLFLASEIMFFGGLFTIYAVYRNLNPEVFGHESRHLDIVLGTVNTAVLLTSSLSVAMAVHAAHHNRRKALLLLLGATVALGSAFLVIKGIEYSHKLDDGLFPPTAATHPAEPVVQGSKLFYGLYFAMTGVHALHMAIGIGVMLWLMLLAARAPHVRARATPIENAGLYWHLVDVIWIFLFPLLYLIDRNG